MSFLFDPGLVLFYLNVLNFFYQSKLKMVHFKNHYSKKYFWNTMLPEIIKIILKTMLLLLSFVYFDSMLLPLVLFLQPFPIILSSFFKNHMFIIFFTMSFLITAGFDGWLFALEDYFGKHPYKFLQAYIAGFWSIYYIGILRFSTWAQADTLTVGVLALPFLLAAIGYSPNFILQLLMVFFFTAAQSFVEEKYFRHVVHRALKDFTAWLKFDRISSSIFTVTFSSLLFGFMHWPQYFSNPCMLLIFSFYHTMLGLQFACIYEEEKGNLGYGSGLHASHNFFIYLNEWTSILKDYVPLPFYFLAPFVRVVHLVWRVESYVTYQQTAPQKEDELSSLTWENLLTSPQTPKASSQENIEEQTLPAPSLSCLA